MKQAFLAGLLTGAAVFLPARASAQSLEQTVALALDHSPRLAASQAREDAAEASLSQARAERNPSASLEGEIGIGRIDPKQFFGLPADSVTPRVAQLGVEWPLFTGGAVSAGIQKAGAGRELARLGTKSLQLKTRLDVIGAYVQSLASQEQIRSFEAMQKTLSEVLRQSRLMFKAGAATSTDVSQAEARLAEAQTGLAMARGGLSDALVRLERMAGQPIKPQADLLPSTPEVPGTLASALELARSKNPNLAQARKASEMADAGRKQAKAEYLPTLAAYAEASSVRDKFFPGYIADSASVGVRVQWKFFTGGRTSAKVSKAEAEARAAKFDAAAAEDEIIVQTTRSFDGVKVARSMLAAAQSRADATKAALRSTRLEVSVGEKPQLALLDAEREALSAEQARIVAMGKLLVAAYTLRSITGID